MESDFEVETEVPLTKPKHAMKTYPISVSDGVILSFSKEIFRLEISRMSSFISSMVAAKNS